MSNILYDLLIGPAKEELRKNLLNGMDDCARMLIVTRRLGENLNIFDSATYANLLNQYAEEHFNATKAMSPDQLLKYMGEAKSQKTHLL